MELTMTNNFGFCELNENEMMMVDGGVKVEPIIAGGLALGTFCVAVACAPATAFVGGAYAVMLIGAALTGAAAGGSIAYGLFSDMI